MMYLKWFHTMYIRHGLVELYLVSYSVVKVDVEQQKMIQNMREVVF
jgi:hypothetical protein